MSEIKNINDANETFSTLGTNCGSSTSAGGGVVVLGNYSPSNHEASRIIDPNYSAPTFKGNHNTVNAVSVSGIATNESEKWQKQPLENISRTILANKSNGGVGCIDTNLKIRKLTPKECFRLMGVKDEDYEKIAKNQSDSSLYHLAGDSIVVNVLMAIFKELL